MTENLNLKMENGVIIVECNDSSERGFMEKEELETIIFDTFGLDIIVSNEQFEDFRMKGRLDISVEEQTSREVKTSAAATGDMFEEPFASDTSNKATITKNENLHINNAISIFESGNGMDAGTLLMKFLEKDYYIWGATIKRGKAMYTAEFKASNDGDIDVRYTNKGIVSIKLLQEILMSVRNQSTGMDSRIVRNYAVQKVGDEYHLLINCIEETNGDITGKYRLLKREDILNQFKIF